MTCHCDLTHVIISKFQVDDKYFDSLLKVCPYIEMTSSIPAVFSYPLNVGSNILTIFDDVADKILASPSFKQLLTRYMYCIFIL